MFNDQFVTAERDRLFLNESKLNWKFVSRLTCCFISMDVKFFNRKYIISPHTNTQRKLFEILLNQPEIRLYLPFYDWFRSKWTSVSFQINRKMVNTIWFWVYFIRFRKDFSVCTCSIPNVYKLILIIHSHCFDSGKL